MALHHYVPVFILRRFVVADAWELVTGDDAVRERVREADERALRGPARKWPLAVLDKPTGEVLECTPEVLAKHTSLAHAVI